MLAHEMAHDTARHSNKLMKRATIAGIFYQAAQIAAVVLTGGIAGIGMYYALQYGFYGLGLVLDLKLLGVSREYELEADQLGVQYAWNSGYDPTGFTRFFDKMATKQGYVNGVSWFRTHPPFYQRMVETQREIMFLPGKEDLITQSSAFEEMKRKTRARLGCSGEGRGRQAQFARDTRTRMRTSQEARVSGRRADRKALLIIGPASAGRARKVKEKIRGTKA